MAKKALSGFLMFSVCLFCNFGISASAENGEINNRTVPRSCTVEIDNTAIVPQTYIYDCTYMTVSDSAELVGYNDELIMADPSGEHIFYRRTYQYTEGIVYNAWMTE